MKSHKRTEEQQKDYIFDIFSKCRSETAPDRLQMYYPTLCGEIYLWYKDYLSVDIDNMGLAISEVINRFTKVEKIIKIPEDKDSFFKYLTASINNEKAGFYREYNENETIKIPKEEKRKLKEVKGFIRMKESQLERKLTADEEKQAISKWFKNQEYIDLYNAMHVGSLTYTSDDGNEESDILGFIDTHSDDPLAEYINTTDMKTVLSAVTSVLDRKQERARPCIKALFTLYCFKKGIKELYPILDQEIIDSFYKEGKKPKQYEIYMKYHPETDKKSAEVMASTNLREFLKEIETCLKAK